MALSEVIREHRELLESLREERDRAIAGGDLRVVGELAMVIEEELIALAKISLTQGPTAYVEEGLVVG